MSIRPAERRLPQTFYAKEDADARATRAFWRGLFIGAVPSVAAFIERVLS